MVVQKAAEAALMVQSDPPGAPAARRLSLHRLGDRAAEVDDDSE